MKRAVLGELRHNVSLLFDSPDPQAVLDIFGSNAAGLYALNEVFGQFIGGVLTQAGDAEGLAELQTILSKVRPAIINPDGTATIIVPTEEPLPTLEETPTEETPTEEVAPSETPTPEETPTEEVTPSETPTPEETPTEEPAS